MPVCSHSSVDTHTCSVEVIVCMHELEEGMYNSFIPDGETYCDKADS